MKPNIEMAWQTWHRTAAFVLAGAAVLLMAGCDGGTESEMSSESSSETMACEDFANYNIAAESLGLPSAGAVVQTAQLVAAKPEMKEDPTPFNPSGVTLARPEYCEIRGVVNSIDPDAPPINFAVNLPTDWNGKALHMGGGGYDGFLQNGLGSLARDPATLDYPINRGYVTFGSDGGHSGNNASFAVNEEALINFAYGHVKKTHDVAQQLIRAFYGRSPDYTYFGGQSGGGRQGMVAVQQFPQDYDGVLVTAPAIDYVNLMLRFNDIATALSTPGGFLNEAEINYFGEAVLDQCDMNDGVADGLVGNYLACDFDFAALRCPGGQDTADTCLSDGQLATIHTAFDALSWKDAEGNEITSFTRFPLGGGEAGPGGLPLWIVGKKPLDRPQPSHDELASMNLFASGISIASFYGNSGVRYLVAGDGNVDTYNFDYAAYGDELSAIVDLINYDDPDIREFYDRGGKLLILHNTADPAISALATVDYYEEVVDTLGKETVDEFVRLYIVPGGDHGGGGAPSKVDMLGMLDHWVADGQEPGLMVAVENGPDMSVTRSKPLCEYPNYPRFNGEGDPTQAANYSCVKAGL